MTYRLRVAAVVLAAAWLLIYGPTVPGGFIKDDFGWVYHSRLDGWSSVYEMFNKAEGFYRPIVNLSFGVTEAVFDNNPIPYAITNLALALGCAAAIYALAIALALPPWAAVVAAAIWAFNFHGINMAVVWLSGRTSLLGTLFAVLAALALTRGRAIAAGMLCFVALMAKEEVLALPLIVTAWQWLDGKSVRSTLPTWIALAVYLALRQHSGAFGVNDAPPFYRFATDPAAILQNIIEYADRSMTFGVLVIIAVLLSLRRLPALDHADRSRLMKGAVWLVCGFALTIWLPVRSSLYAVFPSVGFAIAAASILRAAVSAAAPRLQLRLMTAGLLLPFVLLPVYWSRNVRWTELRELTNDTFAAIASEPLAAPTLIVLEDDLSTRANFRNAFGTMFPEAARLYLHDDVHLWIEPPPPELEGSTIVRPAADRVHILRLNRGRVTRKSTKETRKSTKPFLGYPEADFWDPQTSSCFSCRFRAFRAAFVSTAYKAPVRTILKVQLRPEFHIASLKDVERRQPRTADTAWIRRAVGRVERRRRFARL